MYWDKGISNNN